MRPGNASAAASAVLALAADGVFEAAGIVSKNGWSVARDRKLRSRATAQMVHARAMTLISTR